MGWHGYVLAIGRASEPIQSLLEDDTDRHPLTPGTRVATTLFHCATTSTSHELADACGVDPANPNTFPLEPARVDRDAIRQLSFGIQHVHEDLQAFEQFVDAGFEFLFRTDGF